MLYICRKYAVQSDFKNLHAQPSMRTIRQLQHLAKIQLKSRSSDAKCRWGRQDLNPGLRVSSEHSSNGSSSFRQLTHNIRWSPPC